MQKNPRMQKPGGVDFRKRLLLKPTKNSYKQTLPTPLTRSMNRQKNMVKRMKLVTSSLDINSFLTEVYIRHTGAHKSAFPYNRRRNVPYVKQNRGPATKDTSPPPSRPKVKLNDPPSYEVIKPTTMKW